MFNDYLSNEEARERIRERIKEAETYSLHKRLGYSDRGGKLWIFLLFILMVALVIGVLI